MFAMYRLPNWPSPSALRIAAHVDPEAPLLDGYVRPDVIDEFLLRDDLTWAVGKIGQNIQRPIPEGKHLTVAPEHPLANRKFERARTSASYELRRQTCVTK